MGGALEARHIAAGEGSLLAEAEGEVEIEDGVLVLRRIHVRYTLRGCPPERREAAERAHSVHQGKCPVARSIAGAIAVTTELSFA